MERSGFFNSKYTDGAYDRPYDANDYSSQLGTIIGNGVSRTGNLDLMVSLYGSYGYKINSGRAWINGVWYHNTNAITGDIHSSNVSLPRIDSIVLRLAYVEYNGTPERRIRVAYVEGEAGISPQRTPLVRNDNVWELLLAEIHIPAGATSLSSSNIVDMRLNKEVCGLVFSTVGAEDQLAEIDQKMYEHMEQIDEEWQGMKDSFSSVTLFKKYEARTVLDSTTTRMIIPIEEYAPGLDILEVFCNGIYLYEGDDYTLESNVIIFTLEKPAGNELSFSVYKSIDSRGEIPDLLDMVEKLQDKVSGFQDMTEFNYFCTGVDDNIKLSNMVQKFFVGEDNGQQLKINIYNTIEKDAEGNVTRRVGFDAINTMGGEGTSTTSRFRWFDFGSNITGNRRLILDFTNCDRIQIPISAGSFNVLFTSKNLTLIGASFYVVQKDANSEIQAFSSRDGDIKCYGCSFVFDTYQHTFIAENGLFEDCYGEITQETGEACCFDVHTNGLLIIRGGEFKAYSKVTNSYAIKQTQSGSNLIANGVNCPVVAKAGYNQSHAFNSTGGTAQIRDTISTLTITNTTGGSTSGTIAVSKPRRG